MNGPDGLDVAATMKALEALHTGHVEVVLSPDGIGFNASVSTICRMRFDVLPGSDLPPSVEVTGTWPCRDHKTLTSHLYAGLFQLDFAISKVYKQEELFPE